MALLPSVEDQAIHDDLILVKVFDTSATRETIGANSQKSFIIQKTDISGYTPKIAIFRSVDGVPNGVFPITPSVMFNTNGQGNIIVQNITNAAIQNTYINYYVVYVKNVS